MAAKKTTTQLNSYDEELAQFAQVAAAEKVAAAGNSNSISLRAGLINVGGTKHGTSAPIVVLASVPLNAYYQGAFDPGNPAAPVCFAFGTDDKDTPMVPHKDSLKPQYANCAECPRNQFGSAVRPDGSRGAGKACKNAERVIALVPGAYKDGKPVLAGELGEQPMWTLNLPPTSVRNWASYVVATANLAKRPPFGVLTRLSTIPDEKSQFKVEFSLERNLTQDEYGSIRGRLDEAKALARVPYVAIERNPAPAAAAPAAAAPAKKSRKYA